MGSQNGVDPHIYGDKKTRSSRFERLEVGTVSFFGFVDFSRGAIPPTKGGRKGHWGPRRTAVQNPLAFDDPCKYQQWFQPWFQSGAKWISSISKISRHGLGQLIHKMILVISCKHVLHTYK